jgi:hypothetical protein
MRNRHITKFGSPLTPSGAFYYACDEEGLVQMDVDIQLEQLRAMGNLITPNIKAQVKRRVEQRRAEYHAKVNQIGIPDKLKKMFSITKKAEAKQYCRNIIISEYDLFLLIHNCSQICFTHRSKFKPFVPEHLVISDADKDEMKEGNPKRVLTKTRSALLERRYLHVHLFEHSKDWHCFYFSHQDIEPASTNHWKYGSHLHYVNHLWSKLTKRWVWYKFNKRFTEISDSFHIRFEPFEFTKPGKGVQIDPNNISTIPPWAVNFDPSLAQGCGSVPLPVAEMATRGLWMLKVSLPSKSIR